MKAHSGDQGANPGAIPRALSLCFVIVCLAIAGFYLGS
jgi:hypothetical protein